MKVITASTIGNLISAHIEGDEKKFLAYANFIADAYDEAGEERSARIIRKRIDGTYKNEPQVTLDQNDKDILLWVETGIDYMFCEVIGNRFDNPELLESPNKMDAQGKAKETWNRRVNDGKIDLCR